MSTFDAAIALSQDELNKASAVIYQKVFPQVFSGSKNVNQMGIEYVEWVISEAPQFNLSPASVQSAGAAVAGSLWQQHGSRAGSAVDVTQDDVHQLVSANLPTFEIDFPNVGVNLTPQNNGEPVVYQLSNVKASCYVQVSGSTISLVPQTVTCDPLQDPTDQFFVNLIILPAVQSALQSLLSGLTIPPISFDGITLSTPSIAIVDGYIVAAVNLAAKGTPAPADAGSWTSSGFSLLVSQDLLQTAAASQGKTFQDSGSGGSHAGGYDWSYSLSLVDPRVSISGTNLDITFSLAGSISATAYVLWIPIGLGFDAQAKPDPTAVCALVPQNGKVQIVTQSVSPFTVLVEPSGSIPSKVAGWIVEGIVQAIVGSLSPLISQFLGGITITSIDIPTYTEKIVGISFTLAPTGLVLSNVNGYLALGGDLVVS